MDVNGGGRGQAQVSGNGSHAVRSRPATLQNHSKLRLWKGGSHDTADQLRCAGPRQVTCTPLEGRQPPTIVVRRTLLPQALQPGLQAGVRRQQVRHCGRLQVV